MVSKILSALTFPESKNKNICNPKLSLSVRKPKKLYDIYITSGHRQGNSVVKTWKGVGEAGWRGPMEVKGNICNTLNN